MYAIEWVSAALRDFERLARRAPGEDVDRIQKAVDSLSESPRPRGTVKIAGEEDAYRVRVGHYRVIYSIDDRARKVVIVKVAARGAAYR